MQDFYNNTESTKALLMCSGRQDLEMINEIITNMETSFSELKSESSENKLQNIYIEVYDDLINDKKLKVDFSLLETGFNKLKKDLETKLNSSPEILNQSSDLLDFDEDPMEDLYEFIDQLKNSELPNNIPGLNKIKENMDSKLIKLETLDPSDTCHAKDGSIINKNNLVDIFKDQNLIIDKKLIK